MTPDEMVTFIKARMRNSNDSSLDSLIIAAATVVQERLQQKPELPWFLEVDTNAASSNLTTVADTETVALPNGFLRFNEEVDTPVFLQDSAEDDPWTPLVRDDYAVIKQKYTGTGQPGYFDLIGTNLYLRKIPDAVYTLRLLYTTTVAAITAGGSANLWLTYASDWIMAETGWLVASSMVVMPDVANQFRLEAAAAERRVMHETIARRESGRKRAMGDD